MSQLEVRCHQLAPKKENVNHNLIKTTFEAEADNI